MTTTTNAPKLKVKSQLVNIPNPVFESPNLSEDGTTDYWDGRTQVGWTCTYQVQLKNVSNEEITLEALVVGLISEYADGKPVLTSTLEVNGTITPAMPQTIQPGNDINIGVPVKRIAPYPGAVGMSPQFTGEYTISGQVELSANGGWANH